MSNSNQEIIEARLASYVDGDLDPAQRQEIEQHLAANPQYRLLLEDLRRQRELLRGLPREAAPPEVGENFSIQLERAALLGIPDSTGQEPRMRIGAWPRVFAAAAIVILTAGLATIVYFVLPDRSGRIAINTSTSHSPLSNASRPSMPPDRPVDEIDDPASRPARLDSLASAMSGRRMALVDTLGRRVADRELELRAETISADPEVKSLLLSDVSLNNIATRPTQQKPSLVFVVRAEDAQRVQSQLASFCDDRHIAWQPAHSSDLAAMANSSFAIKTEAYDRNRDEFYHGGAANSGAARQAQDAATRPSAEQLAVSAPTPTISPAAAPAQLAKPNPQEFSAKRAAAMAPAPSAPSAATVADAMPKRETTAAALDANARLSDGAGAGISPATAPSSTGTYFLARNLTRSQAKDLADYLAGEVTSYDIASGIASTRPAEPDGLLTARGRNAVAVAEVLGDGEQLLQRRFATRRDKAKAMEETHLEDSAAPLDKAADINSTQLSNPPGAMTKLTATTQSVLSSTIQPGDELRVRVRRAAENPGPDLQVVKVKDDGTIDAGAIRGNGTAPVTVAGRSVPEAERLLRSAAASQPGNASDAAAIVETVERIAPRGAAPSTQQSLRQGLDDDFDVVIVVESQPVLLGAPALPAGSIRSGGQPAPTTEPISK